VNTETTEAVGIRLGRFLFRWRGWTPVPLLVIGLALGRPTLVSLLVGIAVTAAGEVLRCMAVAHIGSISRTRGDGVGPLITDGPFARSRNPIYLGNLLVGAGMIWATHVPLLTAVYVALFFSQYHVIIAWEESRLHAEHGARFEVYRDQVPRWFPTLARGQPAPRRAGASRPLLEVLRSERSTLIVQAVVFLMVLLSHLFLNEIR
jgi:protein-S-isoprenylcysteine O-methyltransferase Ste14